MTVITESNASSFSVVVESSPGGKHVAVVTIAADEPRRPAVLGPNGLARLNDVLDDLERSVHAGKVDAVVIRGVGKTFCAGADLDMMASITDRDDALALARQGHAVLGRLSQLGVPSIAEINGVALGGGLELALHCTFRIAAESVRAIGLPEISLGLIPGWGGATLLPRLIGIERATTVLLDNPVRNNTLLNAAQALELGVVDRTATDDGLHEAVLRLVDESPTARMDTLPVDPAAREQFAARVLKLAGRPTNPAYAMSRLSDVVNAGRTIELGFRAEDDALADTIMTTEFRNRVYAFHLVNQRARKPAGVPVVAPREIRCVGVIGAGLMAQQFATLFAERLRVPVIMTDLSQAKLDAALDRIAESLDARVERGQLTNGDKESILSHLSTTLDTDEFARCDFVMEAVFEDLAVKLSVLQAVEESIDTSCILATNTSSLSVTAMAQSLQHPERLIGFHFFNPVAVMPLIEVVATEFSSDDSLATAIGLAGSLKKSPVITRDVSGFVVNRILSVFLSRVFDAVDDGSEPVVVSGALQPLRLPMDPFALVDLIGRPVTLHMLESLHEFSPDRVRVSPHLRHVTENPISDSIANDLSSVAPSSGVAEGVLETVCAALATEISLMLDEGIVAEVKDIDLCMIAGANWPVAHGGISRYLDDSGTSERVLGRRFHP